MKWGVALILALVLAASMWFFVDEVARKDNMSDLYPSWYAARALVVEHRNPYSDQVAQETRDSMRGRAMPDRGDKFVYPLYFLGMLAPASVLPFAVVRGLYVALMLLGLPIVLALWVRVVLPEASFGWLVLAGMLGLGSFPGMVLLYTQQPVLFALCFAVLAVVAATRGWLSLAGVLLALSTIKPQSVVGVVGWLLVWSASRSDRRRLWLSFGAALEALVLGAELALPGWIRMWLGAVADYRAYAPSVSYVRTLGPVFLAVAGITAFVVWRFRDAAADSPQFIETFALMLSATVVLSPAWHPYDAVLLLPAVIVAAVRCRYWISLGRLHSLAALSLAIVVAWQWAAVIIVDARLLAGESITPGMELLPFLSALFLPAVCFLALLAFIIPQNFYEIPVAVRAVE